jgi:hypothetical protein
MKRGLQVFKMDWLENLWYWWYVATMTYTGIYVVYNIDGYIGYAILGGLVFNLFTLIEIGKVREEKNGINNI